MLQPGQYQMRDLIMGIGTVYNVKSFAPYDTDIAPTGTGKKPFGHGSWAASEWANERAVPMTVQIRTSSEAETLHALRALKAAFRPVETGGDVEFTWRDAAGEYMMLVRPRMSQPDDRNLSVGITDIACAVVSLVPFHYSATETVTGPITAATTTGGLTVPLRVPFSIGGRSASAVTELVNDGTAETSLQLEIYGPAEAPWVLLNRPDGPRVVRCNLTIPADQVLYIDTGTRSVLLNGTSSRRGDISSDGREWPILPGGPSSTPIRYFGDGHLITRHRSAWW